MTPPTPKDDTVGLYEANAEAFYNDTRVMAPGKDMPAAMSDYDSFDLRVKLWMMWGQLRSARAERDALKVAHREEIDRADWFLAERDGAISERDNYRRMLTAAIKDGEALRTRLAAVEGDAKRLEWMQRNCCEVVCHDLENDAPHWELRYIDPTWNEDKPPLTSDGGSLREAIDAALTPTRQAAGGEG